MKHVYRPLVAGCSTRQKAKLQTQTMSFFPQMFGAFQLVLVALMFVHMLLNQMVWFKKRGLTHHDWQLNPACDWLNVGSTKSVTHWDNIQLVYGKLFHLQESETAASASAAENIKSLKIRQWQDVIKPNK